jgi:uncharacterized protein (TIGR03000 family)
MQSLACRALAVVCASFFFVGYLSAAPGGPLPATFVVSLPADAHLTVDGRATTSTSPLRRFVTPPLQRGKTFQYTLKASLIRDGGVVTLEKTIMVRAGQETNVSLEFPSTPDSSGAAALYRDSYWFPSFHRYAPNVAPLSEQDPLANAGAPGLHHNR